MYNSWLRYNEDRLGRSHFWRFLFFLSILLHDIFFCSDRYRLRLWELFLLTFPHVPREGRLRAGFSFEISIIIAGRRTYDYQFSTVYYNSLRGILVCIVCQWWHWRTLLKVRLLLWCLLIILGDLRRWCIRFQHWLLRRNIEWFIYRRIVLRVSWGRKGTDQSHWSWGLWYCLLRFLYLLTHLLLLVNGYWFEWIRLINLFFKHLFIILNNYFWWIIGSLCLFLYDFRWKLEAWKV